MGVTIKQGKALTEADFNSVLALDVRIFGKEILTNEGMALRRFLKFEDGLIAAYSDDTLVGFISFFNVKPAVYERGVKQQEYIDDNLSASDVGPLEKGKANRILLFDHIVEESSRQQGISKLLLDLTRDYLNNQHNKGYWIEHIFSYAITPEGGQLLSSFGGRKLWTRDKVTFFEIDREIFLRQK
jgi:hypothetical protein